MTATFLPGPAFQCRSGEYGVTPGAQQRSGLVQRNGVRDTQHVVLVDDDRAAVAPVGRRSVATDGVVGVDLAAAGAVLLQPGPAVVTLAARVDETADADVVADLVPGDLGADLGHHACDLVAGDQRVVGLAPFGLDGVDVGVADTGELDVEGHVVGADVTALRQWSWSVARSLMWRRRR